MAWPISETSLEGSELASTDEDFAVGQDAVQGRAHLMREHEADVGAQIRQVLLGCQAQRLRLPEPRLDRRVEGLQGKGLGQVIIGPQLHAVAHSGMDRPGRSSK